MELDYNIRKWNWDTIFEKWNWNTIFEIETG